MYRLAFSVRRVQICTAEDSDCCKGRPAAALQQSHKIVINAHHIHPQFTPCPDKKSIQYCRHNFDKYKHSFIIVDTKHPQTTKKIRKFSPTLWHRYVEMTSYLTSSKIPFTDNDRHLIKSFPEGKTRHCKSTVKRISKQKLTNRLSARGLC